MDEVQLLKDVELMLITTRGQSAGFETALKYIRARLEQGQQIVALIAERDVVKEERDALRVENDDLKKQIDDLKKAKP
jgi:hypothetical protein